MNTFPQRLTLHSLFTLRDDVSAKPLTKYNYLLYVKRSASDWQPKWFGRWSRIVYSYDRARPLINFDTFLSSKETPWKSELRATVPLDGSSICEAAFYCTGSKYEVTSVEKFSKSQNEYPMKLWCHSIPLRLYYIQTDQLRVYVWKS